MGEMMEIRDKPHTALGTGTAVALTQAQLPMLQRLPSEASTGG
jgi:hypothetical protein